ncbi:hypothetical protein JTB14_011617 [Gonioctena quinquepunctata]|nr:hypothetical protein JTB14_011617 [Gonioctena quinquepunctata]
MESVVKNSTTMESVVKNATTMDAVNSDLLVAKIIAMLVLGLTSFLLGMLPVKLTKMISIKSVDGDKNLVISLFLCFGGGVLLFTTFIHLQPEVREGFKNLENSGLIPEMGNGIPLSEIVFCLGFFFVYLVEELAHIFLEKKLKSAASHSSLSVKGCSPKKDLAIPRVTLAKFDDGNISYISTSNKELLNSQTTVNFERLPP